MPEDFYMSIVEKNGKFEFPQMEPQQYHTTALRWIAYVRAGSFERLDTMWQSWLAPPGCILCESEEGKPLVPRGMILFSCEHYAIVWPVGIASRTAGLYSWKGPVPDDEEWDIVQIDDYRKWRLLRVHPLSPAATHRIPEAEGRWELTMKPVMKKLDLVAVRASNGFLEMTVQFPFLSF